MPYDAALAERIRLLLSGEPGLTEKKMFGGIGFMIGGNMACGPMADGRLLVRVAPDVSASLAERAHASLMEQRGKPMRGWVMVAPEGFAGASLAEWVEAGAGYARSLPPK
jgi:TfoX/Sxy family transcriptional regulator of competence genes